MSQKITTEAGAIAALKASREDGLAFFFKRYYSPLAYYAAKMLGDGDAGQEIASEVFVKLWQVRASLEQCESLKPLLYRLAYNGAVTVLRERKATRNKQAAYLYTSEQTTHSLAERHYEHLTETETYHRLYRQLQSLSPRSQEVFRLFYYERKSIKEIAGLLGVSVNTVKTTKLRALQQLRTSKLLTPVVMLLAFLLGGV